MKISELRKTLKEYKKRHGDVEVRIVNTENDVSYELSHVNFWDIKKVNTNNECLNIYIGHDTFAR